MNRRLATLCSLVLMCACAPRPRTVQDTAGPRGAPPGSEPTEARYLRDSARAAAAAGAEPLEVVDFGAGIAGDSFEGFVYVEEDQCLLTYARATGPVDDLDLYVYGDDGTEYATDESPDDLPTLLVCPEVDARLFVSARIAQGRGLVSLGAQLLPRSSREDVARAVGARGHATVAPEEAWPGLESHILSHRGELGGNWVDQRRVALPLDARVPTHVSAKVPAGGCLDGLVVTSDDVAQVQLAALDETGRTFARTVSSGRGAHLLICSPTQASDVTFRIRPYAGRGLAVAVLGVSKGPLTPSELAPPVVVIGGPQQELPERLPPPSFSIKKEIRTGQVASERIRLDGCARVDGTFDDPSVSATVTVWTLDGQLSSRFVLGAYPIPGFVCGRGEARLELEGSGRSGTVELSFRQEALPADHPLTLLPSAGAELLSAVQQGSTSQMPSEVGKVMQAELSSDRLVQTPLVVPAAHCRTVFAAKDTRGYGVEIRIVESGSQQTIAFERGGRSVNAEACAPPGATLNATLELRSIRGKSRALWTTRQHKPSR